ncbi:Ig-like domain-containing protein [Microbulbifer epialgicus]|uniref:Ig-like domain-containing protein n=1 Tax=Microbulbifer epialgicus TaxID=393907 RepID=A0ABV4P2I1_9GAMM
MHILTLYQSISRWFLLLTIAVSLAACGLGGGGSDDGGSGTDPIPPEPDASYIIYVELRDLDTDERVVNPNPEEPVLVQVTVQLDNGDPVASENVIVTTTLGELTPSSGVVMTNDSGVASLELNVEGQEIGSAGEIVVTYSSISTDQEPYSPLRFTVEEPSLQLGYLDGDQHFVPGGLDIPAQDLSSKGSAPISVYVQGPDGNLYTKRMQVVFSSNCSLSQPAAASLDSPVTTTEGKATSTYTAQGCEGEDSISAALTAYPGISASGQLTVMPPEVGSIEFVSAEPEVIHIQGSGGKGTSEVRFQVFSKDDLPVSGVEVNFSLEEGEGNVTLVNSSGTTDAEGQVSAFVNSGSVALPVSVKASITDSNGTSFSAFSRGLVVSAAILDQESFSLSASILNPGGDSIDGVTSTITIRIGTPDNTIPDGTAISFKTEYGRIAGYCTTVDGNCSVDWNSQNPRAPIDYEFLGDDGLMHSLRTIFNTTCPVTGLRGAYPCPQSLGQPYGGRSTILAYALGQETFNDANGNGEFDTGETFVDLPEAFLDHNEDGAFGNSKSSGSCYPDCPEVGGDEELFIPLNDNEEYDSGNGIYNGLRCSKAAEDEGTCSKELVHVRAAEPILVAGSEPYGIFKIGDDYSSDFPEIDIPVGGSGTLYFYLSDKYNGRLPLGTTIKTESPHCDVKLNADAVANSNKFGPSIFKITVNAPDNANPGDSGSVTVEAHVPALEGGSGPAFTDSWQFKCTTN